MFVCPLPKDSEKYTLPPTKFHIDPSTLISFSNCYDKTIWITKDHKLYARGDNTKGSICGSLPEKEFTDDTEFIIKDFNGNQYKPNIVLCSSDYTLYLVSDEYDNSNSHLVYCYREQLPNPLFLNIENKTIIALFGNKKIAFAVDTYGEIMIISEMIFKSPLKRIESAFLPNNDKPAKLCFLSGSNLIIALGQSGKVYYCKFKCCSDDPSSERLLDDEFQEIDKFSGKKVIDITDNDNTKCYAVLNNGQVFIVEPKSLKYDDTFFKFNIDIEKKLSQYKIEAAFSPEIFKTIEGKMIVFGPNYYGYLINDPSQNWLKEPQEVKICEGVTFCTTYVAFVGIDPPPNMANMIIKERKNRDEIKRTNWAAEFRNMKNEIEVKNREISELKSELLREKERINVLESENSELKQKIDSIHIPILNVNEIERICKVKKIGNGQISNVFEVNQNVTQALKVLDLDVENDDQEFCFDSEKLNQLKKNCETLNNLMHPNIIKTLGFFNGDQTHQPAILLEYCESNLKKRIKKLSDEERVSIIVSISSAMKSAHSVGIIHGNLKLENILLDEKNNVKLSDFSFYPFMKQDTMGSFYFIAPEILKRKNDYNDKIDVYAFGTVLFMILTRGEYPDISIIDIGNGKQAEIPKNITNFSSQLIKDCWSFKPTYRPSFDEICNILKDNEQELI